METLNKEFVKNLISDLRSRKIDTGAARQILAPLHEGVNFASYTEEGELIANSAIENLKSDKKWVLKVVDEASAILYK